MNIGNWMEGALMGAFTAFGVFMLIGGGVFWLLVRK